jgi:hypothetical protein
MSRNQATVKAGSSRAVCEKERAAVNYHKGIRDTWSDVSNSFVAAGEATSTPIGILGIIPGAVAWVAEGCLESAERTLKICLEDHEENAKHTVERKRVEVAVREAPVIAKELCGMLSNCKQRLLPRINSDIRAVIEGYHRAGRDPADPSLKVDVEREVEIILKRYL